MKLTTTFTIARPVDEVYAAFLDIDRIATCMPGSRLLGSPAPDTYDGEVSIKVGPLGVAYSGQLALLEADAVARRLRLRAKGREKHGAGNADALVVASLIDRDGGTEVSLDTDLNIRGKVAQFGRGAIGEVTDSVLATFARNVEVMLQNSGTTTTLRGAESPVAQGLVPPAVAPLVAIQPAPLDDETHLDVWSLIIRPALRRHAGALGMVLAVAAAGYWGARAGARHGRR